MLEHKASGRPISGEASARVQRADRNHDIEPSLRALTDLVEQVNRIVYGMGFSSGLNPAQWAAMRYVMRTAEPRRTVGGLAEHQCVTAPTASETVSALVRKGLIERRPSSTDRRSHILATTAQGEALLSSDPLLAVSGVLGEMSETNRLELTAALDILLKNLRTHRRERRGPT